MTPLRYTIHICPICREQVEDSEFGYFHQHEKDGENYGIVEPVQVECLVSQTTLEKAIQKRKPDLEKYRLERLDKSQRQKEAEKMREQADLLEGKDGRGRNE